MVLVRECTRRSSLKKTFADSKEMEIVLLSARNVFLVSRVSFELFVLS